jgi:hypothetical protein
MVFGFSDHLCCRRCLHVAVRAAFAGPNRTLDLGLSAESLRCSTAKAMPAPTKMTASVALKLPGTMQLIQVPMRRRQYIFRLLLSSSLFAMAATPPTAAAVSADRRPHTI